MKGFILLSLPVAFLIWLFKTIGVYAGFDGAVALASIGTSVLVVFIMAFKESSPHILKEESKDSIFDYEDEFEEYQHWRTTKR